MRQPPSDTVTGDVTVFHLPVSPQDAVVQKI